MELKTLPGIFLGCATISASTFAAAVIFRSIKTIGIPSYLVKGSGQYLIYSPLGPWMTISIVAKPIFDRLHFLHTGNAETDRLGVLTIGFVSTYILHSMAERGNQVAAYVLTSLTILQIGLGFFYGTYLLSQGMKKSTVNPLIHLGFV